MRVSSNVDNTAAPWQHKYINVVCVQEVANINKTSCREPDV